MSSLVITGGNFVGAVKSFDANIAIIGNFVSNSVPFEFECEWPNDLCMTELPFGCSEIFAPFYRKQPNGNSAGHFKIKNIYIFECE